MLKVMIAEDDLFMADMLRDALTESGYEVCGIAPTVAEAIALGKRCKPDLAILDLRLADGGRGTEIAAALRPQRGLGILYATGNIGSLVQVGLTKADGDACLGKPYRAEDIVRALQIVTQIVSTGEASQPFPAGFQVLKTAAAPAPAAHANDDSKAAKVIQRLLRQQAALAHFGSFALGESDLDKVLTEAARVCAEGFEVPFCKVCRYRPEHNDLLVEAGFGWHAGVIGCVVSRADESTPQGRAFITGKPVICPDLHQDTIFVLPAFYAEHDIVSTLDVVIKKAGKPYGVLEIDSPVQHDYDQNDINFLTGFANVLAEAVNTSTRNTELQHTIERMQDMVADKDRLLAAKNRVLTEKSSLLAEKVVLAEELQHRVRNNLQLVHGMLYQLIGTTSNGPAKDGVGAIARRVMTLAKVYDHLLGAGLSRTIDFGGYLKTLCSSFEALEGAQNRNITLSCQTQPLLLELDSVTALGLAVAELISNSYRHGFPGGSGKISVSLVAGDPGEDATITFADDGVGFKEAGDSKRHGLGLVRRLMQQVHGSAKLRSDHGTAWTLRFPVARQFAPAPG